ncbi:hypothetical protein FG379_001224 [Cryptosporidium bovis]|uniref:uncharacterized protein n=1 Tax=Cryptosporidium bovis TaxID=310047 RepID=UPI00351A228A|nr:hypothetical protein FG379_001224 [Cryptosporidium bovis]
MSETLGSSFFMEGRFESLFTNTMISRHYEIQKHILEYAFDFETFLNISYVNKDCSAFFKEFKRFLLDKIRSVGTLEHQDWMNTNPNSWLAWLLIENEYGSRNMIPLDPKIIMKIFFNHFRKLYPISYKRRIHQENFNSINITDPYVSVELSGISLGTRSVCVEDCLNNNDGISNRGKKSFLTIYEMFSSDEHVFGIDIVYGRPYDATCSEYEGGGGELIIHVHPRHIFEILSHRSFVDCLHKDVFYGIKKRYKASDWSGYLDKESAKLMSKKILKKEIINKYENYTKNCNKRRNDYPFINMLLTSFFCHKRCGIGQINDSLYNIAVGMMENFFNKIDTDEGTLFNQSISYNSPNLFFFQNHSTPMGSDYYRLFFNYLTSKEGNKYKNSFLDLSLKDIRNKECEFQEYYDDKCNTDSEFVLNWDKIDGKSPLFENSYKNRYKPPWRTSIDCIKNAMREKQLKAIQRQHELQCFQVQQPSIGIENERLRNDAGCIRRLRQSSLDEYYNLGEYWEDNVERELHENNNTGENYNHGDECGEFDSPSLVASGFVMGVRCLPVSTAVTSLGSLIGEGTSSSSTDNNEKNALNSNSAINSIRQNSQRLSIPLSDITGRISSCHTLSSIATSWGTPVPITRTIPMDDILGRQQGESSRNQDTINGISSTNENKSHFSIRLKVEDSEGECEKGDCDIEEDGNDEAESIGGKFKIESCHVRDTVVEKMSNLQIGDIDASLLAKETLKSWKYVNYDFDELGEDREEEDEHSECEYENGNELNDETNFVEECSVCEN